MANEATAAGATMASTATTTTDPATTTLPTTASVRGTVPLHTRHGPHCQRPVHLDARRRGHTFTTLSGFEPDAHAHHVRRARAMVAEMTGRDRLHSSPALLTMASPRKPALPSAWSSPSLEVRSAVAVDLDSNTEHVDTGDEGDDEGSDPGLEATGMGNGDGAQSTEAIVLALALLQQAQEASVVDGVVTLSKDALAQILRGFITALKMAVSPPPPATTATNREVVEHQMQRLFVSHANVFDEKMQNFIIQNFIQETDYAKAFRSAMRRTSLVKRCLKAMYPSEKHASTPPSPAQGSSHWHASLAQQAMVTAHLGALEACPEVKDSEVVRTVQQLLARVSDWDFDLFSLVEAVPGQTLLLVANELLDKYELATHFRTTKPRQLEFLRQVQARYLPNAYHNGEHAADVAQALHHFLAVGQLGVTVNPRSKCAALVAAIVHDVGHTSSTNNFHIACNDDLAIQYVYRSPLEHMHCALAFQIMKSPKAKVLVGLTRIEQMEVRTLITDMVLATDNSVHAAYLAKLEGLLSRANDTTTWTLSANPDDERLVLQMALHAADVSNPAKSQEQCCVWAERILVEFYQQGDKERELELPVSIGYDRENPIPLEKMQAGFILGIVRPLFTVFCRLPGAQLGHCLTQLDENLAYWQSEISRSQAETR